MPTSIPARARTRPVLVVSALAVLAVGWAVQTVATVWFALSDAPMPPTLPLGVGILVASGAALLPDLRVRASRLTWNAVAPACIVAWAAAVAAPFLVEQGYLLGALTAAIAGSGAAAFCLADAFPPRVAA